MANVGQDLGKLLLRLMIGGLLLFHGLFKLTHGIDGITSMLQEAHLPPALAYGVYVGEVVAPILLLLGQWARAAGLLVACDMVMAIALMLPESIPTTSAMTTGAIHGRGARTRARTGAAGGW